MSRHTSPARVADTGLEQRGRQLSDLALFFRKFVEKGRGISSAVPSSRSMALRLLDEIEWDRPGTIIELGAGTGAITEHVVERLRPHHRFIAVENDADFVEILRRRFPEQTVLHADASRLAEPMAHQGVQRVRYVISGLPTPALPKRSLVRFSHWLHDILEPDGLFLQITIVPLVYRRFYRRMFSSVTHHMVWRNFPSGGIYACRGPASSLRRP